MLSARAIPWLLTILVGLALGLAVWGFMHSRSQRVGAALQGHSDTLLLGLLVFAAFAMGMFVTYLLLANVYP
jgi:hypothetical protein